MFCNSDYSIYGGPLSKYCLIKRPHITPHLARGKEVVQSRSARASGTWRRPLGNLIPKCEMNLIQCPVNSQQWTEQVQVFTRLKNLPHLDSLIPETKFQDWQLVYGRIKKKHLMTVESTLISAITSIVILILSTYRSTPQYLYIYILHLWKPSGPPTFALRSSTSTGGWWGGWSLSSSLDQPGSASYGARVPWLACSPLPNQTSTIAIETAIAVYFSYICVSSKRCNTSTTLNIPHSPTGRALSPEGGKRRTISCANCWSCTNAALVAWVADHGPHL